MTKLDLARIKDDGRYEHPIRPYIKDGKWCVYRTAQDAMDAGFLPFVDKPLQVDDAHIAVATEFADLVDGKVVRRYDIQEKPVEPVEPTEPPPPRVFSKLKVVLALTEAGLWLKVRDYIVAQGLYDLFLAAQDFREDDQYFIQGLTALKAEFSITDEQVEQILERSVV